MKLISLNTWGGRRMESLKIFLKKHNDVDIFCMQEVYHEADGKDTLWTDGTQLNSLNEIKNALPDYDCYYRPHLGDWWGLAMFVKKGVLVTDEGEHFVHKFKGHDMEREVRGHTAKNIQFLKTKNSKTDKPVTVLNFHGLWNGQGKSDTAERLTQSKKIVEFIKSIKGDYVFCGDFNLTPDTESLGMIVRELGCRDLIKENGITSTRTHLYAKPNKFADYVFVSKGLAVKDFKVLDDVVSDHLALLVEF